MAGWLPLSKNWHNHFSSMQGSLQPPHRENIFFSKQKATLLQKSLGPSKAAKLVQTEKGGCKTEDTFIFPGRGVKMGKEYF